MVRKSVYRVSVLSVQWPPGLAMRITAVFDRLHSQCCMVLWILLAEKLELIESHEVVSNIF